MNGLSRIFVYEGYEILDTRISMRDKTVEFVLDRNDVKEARCHRCQTLLGRTRGRHRLKIRELAIMGFKTFVSFWRLKADCSKCKKARSEAVSFLAKESPHLTQRYAWWIGTMCEFAPVSRVAEFTDNPRHTVQRVDYKRLRRMLKHYRIPEASMISVDEVYARKKPRKGETRDDRFFTVITDLRTRRVIWVADSRRKEALDQFFLIIGKEAAAKIKIVACDQHEGYKASVHEHCPNAMVVWDKFHLLQSFGEVVNETRKEIFEHLASHDEAKKLCRGKYRFLFLKKNRHRTKDEVEHIEEAMARNGFLYRLELIKELMHQVFDEKEEKEAWRRFQQLGSWISQTPFHHLKKWWGNLEANWDTFKNYFLCRVTSAVSEGQNNVIKALKRRAYGYRNMEYFKLKILQVCGYLNSRFIKTSAELRI